MQTEFYCMVKWLFYINVVFKYIYNESLFVMEVEIFQT